MRRKKAKPSPARGKSKESVPERNRSSKQRPLSDDEQAVQAITSIRDLASNFFDHGVVVVSREVDGRTEYYNTMFGNQFAIKGMMETFMSGSLESEDMCDESGN
jgi:hypothetical protein